MGDVPVKVPDQKGKFIGIGVAIGLCCGIGAGVGIGSASSGGAAPAASPSPSPPPATTVTTTYSPPPPPSTPMAGIMSTVSMLFGTGQYEMCPTESYFYAYAPPRLAPFHCA